MLYDHLTCPARLKILKVLARSSSPLGFREIVAFSGVGIRSAQLALRYFVNNKIVAHKKPKSQGLSSRSGYQLLDSAGASQLKEELASANQLELRERSVQYSRKAPQILRTAQELLEVGQRIRRAVKQPGRKK